MADEVKTWQPYPKCLYLKGSERHNPVTKIAQTEAEHLALGSEWQTWEDFTTEEAPKKGKKA